MAADAKENVLLQGYAVTGASTSEQAIVTQGYAFQGGPPPPPGSSATDIIEIGGWGTRTARGIVKIG